LRFAHDPQVGESRRAAIAITRIGYLAYSLFRTTCWCRRGVRREIRHRQPRTRAQTCSRYSFCIAKLIVEALAVALGAMFGPLLRRSRAPLARTAGIGLLLGGSSRRRSC
jgi:hypothetical protein